MRDFQSIIPRFDSLFGILYAFAFSIFLIYESEAFAKGRNKGGLLIF